MGAGLFAADCAAGEPPAPDAGSIDACEVQLDRARKLWSIVLACSAILFVILGEMYDLLGPRCVAVFGGLCCSATTALLSLALSRPELNVLAWPAVLCNDALGASEIREPAARRRPDSVPDACLEAC